MQAHPWEMHMQEVGSGSDTMPLWLWAVRLCVVVWWCWGRIVCLAWLSLAPDSYLLVLLHTDVLVLVPAFWSVQVCALQQ